MVGHEGKRRRTIDREPDFAPAVGRQGVAEGDWTDRADRVRAASVVRRCRCEEWALRQPSRPALLSEGESFTYGELAARINRYARWARGLGIGSGRTVCLIMPNRPDYLACWLGISRVGGMVALINTRWSASRWPIASMLRG